MNIFKLYINPIFTKEIINLMYKYIILFTK